MREGSLRQAIKGGVSWPLQAFRTRHSVHTGGYFFIKNIGQAAMHLCKYVHVYMRIRDFDP